MINCQKNYARFDMLQQCIILYWNGNNAGNLQSIARRLHFRLSKSSGFQIVLKIIC
jgi:hypothetical protein